MYIYRAWITDKSGNKIYAKDYGKRAFKIWVDDNKKAQILDIKAVFVSWCSPFILSYRKEGRIMAKTKSSSHGLQNKKIVTVNGYKKKDGTKVRSHRRSTPNQIGRWTV